MKTLISTFFALVVSATTYAQHQDIIALEVKKYNQAFLNKDYDTYVSHMIPSVVKVAGGVELMKGIVIDQAEIYDKSKMSIISIEADSIGLTTKGEKVYHAILRQDVIMKIGENKFNKKAYYLAESDDKGKSWTFLDLEPYDQQSLKVFLPSLPEELNIPTAKPALKIED